MVISFLVEKVLLPLFGKIFSAIIMPLLIYSPFWEIFLRFYAVFYYSREPFSLIGYNSASNRIYPNACKTVCTSSGSIPLSIRQRSAAFNFSCVTILRHLPSYYVILPCKRNVIYILTLRYQFPLRQIFHIIAFRRK